MVLSHVITYVEYVPPTALRHLKCHLTTSLLGLSLFSLPLTPSLAPRLKCTCPVDFSKTWLWLWRRSSVSAIASACSPRTWSPPVLPSITPFLASCTISRTILLHPGVCYFLYFPLIASSSCMQAFKKFNHNCFLFRLRRCWRAEERRGEDRTTMDV